MDSNSEEESNISESELNDYVGKPYEQLRAGKYKVKGPYGTFGCPFCVGKKKQDYKYKDLLQHASGVHRDSSNRSWKQKANHLALARYLETDLASEAGQTELPVIQHSVIRIPENDDVYVWPWMGIVVNLVREGKDKNSMCDSEYLLDRFSKYRPLEVHTFWNENDKTIEAVEVFSDNWNGFLCATEFEKGFEINHCGKEDWNVQKRHRGSRIFGWCARVDDYDSQGPIGEYLCMKGRLRSVSDLEQEVSQSKKYVLEDLTGKIDLTNESIDELQSKYYMICL